MSAFTKMTGVGPVINYDGELLESVKTDVRGNLQKHILSIYEESLSYCDHMHNTLIIHHDDSDGYCSAAVIGSFERYMMKSSVKYICISNYFEDMSKYQSDIDNATVVYLVDLSFKKPQIDYLINHSKSFIWIDHHESSMSVEFELNNTANAYKFIHSETGISAAALCWIYAGEMICAIRNVLPNGFFIVPEIVEHVSLYDTFHPDMNEDFYYGINTVGYDNNFSLDDLWPNLIDPYMSTMKDDGHNQDMYELAEEIMDDRILASGSISKLCMNNFYSHYRKNNLLIMPIEIVDDAHNKKERYTVAIMNIDANSFAFGDEYYNCDAVIKYTYQADGMYHYSMYSKESVDCRRIAESFGGGGHRGAAGWRSDKNLMQEFLHSKKEYFTITL